MRRPKKDTEGARGMKNLIGVLLAICFFFFLFFLMLALTTPNGPIIKDWQYIGPFSAYEAQFPLQIEQRGPFSFRLRSEIRRAQESYLILYNVYASRIDLVRDGVVIDSMGQLEDDAHFWSALPIPFQFGEEGRGRTERIELVVYSSEAALSTAKRYIAGILLRYVSHFHRDLFFHQLHAGLDGKVDRFSHDLYCDRYERVFQRPLPPRVRFSGFFREYGPE